jgi:hypothetical protein
MNEVKGDASGGQLGPERLAAALSAAADTRGLG